MVLGTFGLGLGAYGLGIYGFGFRIRWFRTIWFRFRVRSKGLGFEIYLNPLKSAKLWPNTSKGLPIVSIVVPFFGLTKYIINIL